MSALNIEENIAQVAKAIIQGKIILYPTDTVWGIGCDATNEEAIQKIFIIKNRPQHKSMILLVSDIEQLDQYVTLNSFMLDFLSKHNTPTTVIYPTTKISLAKSVYAIDGSVAIRIVNHQFCQSLIKKINVPLVSTSANLSNQPTSLSFQEINAKIKKQVDWIAPREFEQSIVAKPSSIIRFTSSNEIDWIRK